MADGVNVGDATLFFLGNTTSLDEAFVKTDSTGARLEPANVALKEMGANWKFAGETASTAGAEGLVAGEEIAEGAEIGGKALREAKGEAALLGEEFGVHLPRHVRSFIAEIPGVGEALQAAFTATAILFVIQAVVELTNKVTEFVSAHFIFTEEMKASTAEVVKNNVALGKQADAFKAAKEAVDNFGKTQEEVAEEKVKKLNASIKAQEAELYDASLTLSAYHAGLRDLTEAERGSLDNRITLANAALKALNEQLIQGQLEQVKAIAEHQLKIINLHQATAGALLNLQEQQYKTAIAGTEDAESKRYEIEERYDQKRYELKKNAIQQEIAIQKQLRDVEKVAQLNAELDKLDNEHTQHYFAELEKQKEAFAHTLQSIKQEALSVKPADIQIVLPDTVRRILAINEAAKTLGITLRSDLVTDLDRAKKAQQEYTEAGGKNVIELKQFDLAVRTAQHNLDNFGHSFDKLKLKGETSLKGLLQDLRQGVAVTHELGLAGHQAFDQISKGLESAFSAAILGEQSFGKAIEQATAQALAQLAAQALVKAIFYTAEGFAALAGFAYGPASQYFEAAGIMAAVGGAAGAAAFGLSHAGGSGGSQGSPASSQQQNSVSNTSGQAGGRQTTIGVQQFEGGGLVSAPTLAIIGENTAKSGPEAVLPLHDKDSLRAIAAAMAPHIAASGGNGPRVYVKGLISGDNLGKVMRKMDQRIRKGQSNLTSSNSFRITRRGA